MNLSPSRPASIGLGLALLLASWGPAVAQQAPVADPATPPADIDPLDRPADLHPPGTQAPSDFAYAVNAGLTSDYIFRGVDQTHGGVQGFAGVDAAYRSLYAGTWTSNVNFSAFANRRAYDETDLYAGWRPSLAGFNLDIGAIYYGYVGQSGDESYAEAYLKVARSIGPLSTQAVVYASPDYPDVANGGYYAEGKLAYAVTSALTISGVIGHKDAQISRTSHACAGCFGPDGAFTYTTWNFDAAYALSRNITLDLRYSDTDAHADGSAFGDRLVFSARAALP